MTDDQMQAAPLKAQPVPTPFQKSEVLAEMHAAAAKRMDAFYRAYNLPTSGDRAAAQPERIA